MSPLLASSLVRRCVGPVALALVALPVGAAHAATWGSFDASRMAYSTGTLEGTAHATLRGIIEANGDEVGSATSELTPEYLGGVDVFYTAMLSDGTGPSAGSPGTLSVAERNALQAWIADGGTLVVTVDSNGFEGPYPLVYDSWLSDYGVTDFGWVFSFATGMPIVAHTITDGIGAASLDGYSTFTIPDDGEIIATIDGGLEPYLVVFEPATGFAEGGRILVAADHYAFTDTYIGDLDNEPLAVNVVEWAAGECGNGILEGDEECDDGNLDDGDGCSAQCLGGGGGTTGGEDTTGGATGADGSSGGDSGVGSTTLPGDDAASTSEGSGTTGGGDGVPPPLDDGEGEGCGCRSGGGGTAPALLPMLVALGLRRRRVAAR